MFDSKIQALGRFFTFYVHLALAFAGAFSFSAPPPHRPELGVLLEPDLFTPRKGGT